MRPAGGPGAVLLVAVWADLPAEVQRVLAPRLAQHPLQVCTVQAVERGAEAFAVRPAEGVTDAGDAVHAVPVDQLRGLRGGLSELLPHAEALEEAHTPFAARPIAAPTSASSAARS